MSDHAGVSTHVSDLPEHDCPTEIANRVDPPLPSELDQTLPSPAGFMDGARMLPEIEGYEVLEEIGRGGMGAVYRARQRAAGGRVVALKVMLGEAFASSAELRRFEREVEIASDLNHASIAHIYDSGLVQGRHYFAMEYVEGQALDTFCKTRDLPVKGRLRLFAAVCEAVAYAHRRGVIHRDLKPSNILVDNEGVPHVLDFGLAKTQAVAGEVAASRPDLTMDGMLLGTLPYMAPEQAEGKASAVDTRTDVYALGVILYELLTGKYPYEVTGQMADVLKRIAEAEPRRPSTVNRQVGDEVETIILRALHKLPDRRYSGADDFARDVTHFLAGEPIEAKRDSGLYVLRKTARRYRVPLAFATVIVLLIVAAAVTNYHLYRRAEKTRMAEANQRRLAEEQRDRAIKAEQNAASERDKAEKARAGETEQRQLSEAQRDRALKAEQTASIARDEAQEALRKVKAAQVAEQAAKTDASRANAKAVSLGYEREAAEYRARLAEYGDKIEQVKRYLEQGELDHAASLLWETSSALRGWEWGWLMRVAHPELITFEGADYDVGFVDGGRLLVYAAGNRVTAWDVREGRTVRDITGLDRIAFASTKPLVAGTVRIPMVGRSVEQIAVYDVSNGQEVARFRDSGGYIGSGGYVEGLTFVQQDTRLAIGLCKAIPGSKGKLQGGRRLELWDFAGTNLVATRAGSLTGEFYTVAADGWIGLRSSASRELQVIDAATLQVAHVFPLDPASGTVRLNRDGSSIVYTCEGNISRVIGAGDRWTVRDTVMPTKDSGTHWGLLAYAPTSDLIVRAGTLSGRIALLSATNGVVRGSIAAHAKRVSSLAISPDGTHLASGNMYRGVNSEEDETKLWRTADICGGNGSAVAGIPRWGASARTQDIPPRIGPCVVHPDGRHILFVTPNARGAPPTANRVHVLDIEKSLLVTSIVHTAGSIQALAMSRTGDQVAIADTNGVASVWNWPSWEPRAAVTCAWPVAALGFSTKSNCLNIVTANPWRNTKERVPEDRAPVWDYDASTLFGAVMLADGRVVQTDVIHARSFIWDYATGQTSHEADVGDEQEAKRSVGYALTAGDVVSADGRYEAHFDRWGRVSSWRDAAYPDAAAPVPGKPGSTCAVLSRIGLLWCAFDDGSIQALSIANGRVLASIPRSGASLRDIQLTPTEDRLVGLTADGHVVVWDTKTGRECVSIQLREGAAPPGRQLRHMDIGRLAISADGRSIIVLGRKEVYVLDAFPQDLAPRSFREEQVGMMRRRMAREKLIKLFSGGATTSELPFREANPLCQPTTHDPATPQAR